jgi:hypothetical protein
LQGYIRLETAKVMLNVNAWRFVLLAFICFYNVSMATAQDDNITEQIIEEMIEPTAPAPYPYPDPDPTLIENEDPATPAPAEECCHTRGDGQCGGACDICCAAGLNAVCDPGSCDPNNPFECTCESITSCICK